MALFYVEGLPIGWMAIMLAVLASMGGFIFGISDILLMDDFLLRFANCSNPQVASTCSFTDVREGLIVALLSIGTLVGALLGAPTADWLGRRYAMSVECGVFMVGVLIQITTSRSWQQFAIGRLAETAPPQIRGTLTATYQLFITFGILVAYCISIGTRHIPGAGSWRTVVGIGFVWPMILGVGILFMPESPRWLTAHGRFNEARRSVALARGIPDSEADKHQFIHREIAEMRSAIEKESKEKAGWMECFNPRRKQLYRTLLCMALQMFQQLTGANYFFYYGATIFQSVGISDSFVTQIILGAVNFGSAGTAMNPMANKNIGVLMIVSACLFIFGYAMTWAPGIWILIGETFPTRTRARQAALATASNWLWNFLLAFFTPFIVKPISYRYGFVFAACNLTGAVM
uniref:Major facilitator superfamily (MFS) profile domain-containing protein n=1 Tax=Ganoderma boninense TaxID=34458 RepID=A0A5K1K354_9APHY|nr:Uncharacterized protein [Ganoderma boninense]